MDKARKQTDKLLNQMEKKISKIYDQAYKDLSKSWNQFMAVHKPMVQEAYDKYMDARKNGTTQEIFDARTYYERVLNNTILQNERYKAMTDELAEKISHVNEVALDYVNGNMAKVYTTNYNAFGDEKIDGYSFSLTNEQAVKNLAKSDKALLPTKQLNKNKDLKWNHKQINSQMMQGILRGESIPKLAKRLENVIGMDKNSSIRNARTMTTAAENKGRQDSYEKAQDDGVIMTREWIATGDDRTRDWHRDLDGVEVAVDEPWVNILGDGTEDEIMYPGDPDADPANTYNCRCSIRAVVKGFAWNDKDVVDSEAEETDILSGYKEDMLNADKKDKLNYIFESDPDLAFSLGRDVSEDELNKVLSDLLESNNHKISIMGEEYAHIEKNAVKYLNNTMNVTEEEKSSFSNYVKNIDSFTINNKLRENELNDLPDYLQKTVRDMDNAISRNILSEPIAVTRFADEKYLANILDMDLQDVYSLVNRADDLSDTLESLKGLGITEKSYLSASTDVDANVFGNFTVKMDLLADSGTPVYFTNNVDESEVIFGRDSKYVIEDIKIEKDESFSRNRINLVVKLQNE